MSRRAIAGGALIAIAVVAGGLAGHVGQALVGSAIAIAVIAAVLVVRDLATDVRAAPTPKRTAGPQPIERLRALDRAVAAAVESSAGYERELRPLLRSIAMMRLARRGMDADSSRAAADAIVGDELGTPVRGGASATPSRSRAAATAELQALIEQLERI